MSFINSNTSTDNVYYGKEDIMRIFNCRSDKALKILKIMFQMREANKIGKEYYVEKQALDKFMKDMRGKIVHI